MIRFSERILTTELAEHAGENCCIAGWLHATRRMGGITFVVVRDGWGVAQVVVEDSARLATLGDAAAESILAVWGRVVASDSAPGGYEIHDPDFTVIEPVTGPLPIALGKRELRANLSTLLDHAVLTNRHPLRRAVLRLCAGTMRGFRETLLRHGFTEVQTPKIGATATEGGANVFAMDYFGRPAYLAQSPQFYKQVMVGIFERVFEVGPVFRAEPHDTTRHLNEYVSMDVEFGFIDDHHTVMHMLREVLAGIFATLQTTHAADLDALGVTVPVVPETIPCIDFVAAHELIYELYGVDERAEPDLSPREERLLGEWAIHEHGSVFLFVSGYPMVKRPFYTHPDPVRPAYSNSFDLLFRGVELVTGGQRLHRYADYLSALERAGLAPEPFAWYLDVFKYGMPPHGGFAIGLERLVMQLTGLSSVKLAATFPRDLHRLTP